MTKREHSVKLTGGQLRVLNDALNALLNDPDWTDYFGERDWAMLGRASDRLGDAWRDACRAESTPSSTDQKRE